MRGTEQKNGREFVLGRRGTSVARARHGPAGGGWGWGERVRGIPMPRKKGGIYRRDWIIGDSLFLLVFPSRVPFQFTRPIYRLSLQLIIPSYVPPFFADHPFSEPCVLYLID